MSAVKAITFWQPYASLIAVGAKTIETRGRGTSFRGTLLIHAAKHVMRLNEAPDAWDYWPLSKYEATRSMENNTRFPQNMQSDDPLPLGAVVAVAELTGCQQFDPSVIWTGPNERLDGVPQPAEHHGWMTPGPAWRWILVADDADRPNLFIKEQERPFGDFTPGRWGLLLEDVRQLSEPVPARGQQAWPWTPDPALVAECMERVTDSQTQGASS